MSGHVRYLSVLQSSGLLRGGASSWRCCWTLSRWQTAWEPLVACWTMMKTNHRENSVETAQYTKRRTARRNNKISEQLESAIKFEVSVLYLCSQCPKMALGRQCGLSSCVHLSHRTSQTRSANSGDIFSLQYRIESAIARIREGKDSGVTCFTSAVSKCYSPKVYRIKLLLKGFAYTRSVCWLQK